MQPYFGLRAHDFGVLPASQLASKIAQSGASCVQLALSKALPDGPMLPDELGEGGLERVQVAFAESQLNVAVLGCYIDMVCPDTEAQESALQRFEAHLKAAPALDCRIVGTETGSPKPYGENAVGVEAAFQVALKNLLRLIRSAEASWAQGKDVYVGVEPVAEMHALSTLEHAKILIERANSQALGIIFDPTNLIPQKGLVGTDMDGFLDDCFSTFGEHIIAIHAKDFRMEAFDGGLLKSGPLPAGEGEMDWPGLFSRLARYGKQSVPILLEETGPDKAEATFAFLKSIADKHFIS